MRVQKQLLIYFTKKRMIEFKGYSSILKNPISAQSSINTTMTRSPNVSLPTEIIFIFRADEYYEKYANTEKTS